MSKFTALKSGIYLRPHIWKTTPSDCGKLSKDIMPYLATAESYLEQSILLISARPTTVRSSKSIFCHYSLTISNPIDKNNNQIHNFQAEATSLTIRVNNIISPEPRVFEPSPFTAGPDTESVAYT